MKTKTLILIAFLAASFCNVQAQAQVQPQITLTCSSIGVDSAEFNLYGTLGGEWSTLEFTTVAPTGETIIETKGVPTGGYVDFKYAVHGLKDATAYITRLKITNSTGGTQTVSQTYTTSELPTGVAALSLPDFKVVAQPDRSLRCTVPDALIGSQVCVYNILAQLVYSGTLTDTSQTIEIAGIQNGAYCVAVTMPGNKRITRVVRL